MMMKDNDDDDDEDVKTMILPSGTQNKPLPSLPLPSVAATVHLPTLVGLPPIHIPAPLQKQQPIDQKQPPINPKLKRRELMPEDFACLKQRELIIGEEIGRGSFKTVYSLYRDIGKTQLRNDVLQVVDISTPSQAVAYRTEVKLIQQITAETKRRNLSPIVVSIQDSFECAEGNKAFVVQERYPETLLSLGLKQKHSLPGGSEMTYEKIGVLVYTRDQLIRSFALALELYTRYHIIHGDLKPDNIFMDSTGKMLIGDLGLSGAVASNINNTNNDTTKVPNTASDLNLNFAKISQPQQGFSTRFKCDIKSGYSEFNPKSLEQYNLWQLELFFTASTIVFFIPTNSNNINNNSNARRLQIFTGISDLKDENITRSSSELTKQYFNKRCATYPDRMQVIRVGRQKILHQMAYVYVREILSRETNNQLAVMKPNEVIQSFMENMEYYKSLPPWQKVLILEGLQSIIPKTNAVYLATTKKTATVNINILR